MVRLQKEEKELVRDTYSVSSRSFLSDDLVYDFKEVIKKYNLSSNQIRSLFKDDYHHLFDKSKDFIPLCVFFNDELSSLETIVKYLKEELVMKFCDIARLLNRDEKTIWATYNNAKKKKSEHFILSDSKYFLPTSIFKNRAFGVLGCVVKYLKDEAHLSYHEIGVLLKRDDRTIWTTYKRVLSK